MEDNLKKTQRYIMSKIKMLFFYNGALTNSTCSYGFFTIQNGGMSGKCRSILGVSTEYCRGIVGYPQSILRESLSGTRRLLKHHKGDSEPDQAKGIGIYGNRGVGMPS